jgi:pyruvate kinase
MDLPTVPVAQKRIARMCQSAGKPCIIATQMLESMTRAATPTRAEVSDVANAVLDHADAVMLSGETAVGDNPVAAVDMMNRVVEAVQDYYDEIACPQAVLHPTSQTTAALAEAVRQVLASEPIAAVAVFTASGMTSRLLAKSRLTRPILGISNDEAVVRRMSLYYGVTAVRADAPEHTRDVLAMASRFCIQRGLASKGERIVVLSGRPIGERGSTNTLVIHEVG